MLRVAYFVSIALVAGTFGPYLVPSAGMRLDHVVLYGLLAAFILFGVVRGRLPRIHRGVVGPMVVALAVWLWMVVRTAAGDTLPTSFGQRLSHLENFSEGPAVLLLIGLVTAKARASQIERVLRGASWVYVLLLAVNGLVAGWSALFGPPGALKSFVAVGQYSGVSVAELSSQMGRYLGVFNQPAEAGMAYSLGLMTLVVLVSELTRIGEWIACAGAGVCVVLGGVLTVSKVFLLGGVPVVLLWMILREKGRLKLALTGMTTVGAAWAAAGELGDRWLGLDFLLRLTRWQGQGDMMYFLTAGRFGGEGTYVTAVFTDVWERNPLTGWGLGAVTVLDNAFLEWFAQGGLIGLALGVSLLATVTMKSMLAWHRRLPMSGFAISVIVLLWGASSGTPVVTLNRFAIVFWTIFALLFVLWECEDHNPPAVPLGSEGYPLVGNNRWRDRQGKGIE